MAPRRWRSAAHPPSSRGFWFLIATQFQGAFNENGLKNLVVFIILATIAHQGSRDRLVLIVGTLFSLPFILFSMTGGFLADRYSKRTVTIWTKFIEIAVMLLALPASSAPTPGHRATDRASARARRRSDRG